MKRHDHQPRHVAGRQERDRHPDAPEHGVPAHARLPDDLVLREEAGERENAGDRERGDPHRPPRDRHETVQAAVVPHVVRVAMLAGRVPRAVQRVDHRTGPEEEKGLEEGVRHQVEDSRRVRADPDRQEHVAELGDRAVGEHLLDVVLLECDRRCEERGARPDGGHDGLGERREGEENARASDQVDAGGHHRGGVDQRRDGGRAGHRVG